MRSSEGLETRLEALSPHSERTNCAGTTLLAACNSLEKESTAGRVGNGLTQVETCDVTFVEALFLERKSPDQLIEDTEKVLAAVSSTFRRYGRKLNWRSCKAARERRGRILKLRQADGSLAMWAPPSDPAGDPAGPMERVCVVHKYKHLGTWLTSDGSLTIEMKHRAASACGALVALERTVLGKRRCSWEMQCQLVQLMVMPRILFKAHVWTLWHKDTVLLHRPYMRALRRIARAGWRPSESTPPIADSEVRKRQGAPSIECTLIKARLQYLGRVCRERHNFPTLWAILDKKCGGAHEGAEADVSCHPWVQQLLADMKVLWALSPTARQSPPSPEELGCGNSWLGMRPRTRESGELWLAACTLWKAHFDKKGEESRVKSHPGVSPWMCSERGEHFISEMAMDQHARRKHGRRCTLTQKIQKHFNVSQLHDGLSTAVQVGPPRTCETWEGKGLSGLLAGPA